MHLMNAVRKGEQKFNAAAERFLWRHPILGFFSIFIGMPLVVLVGVCASTIILTFPMAFLMGWL